MEVNLKKGGKKKNKKSEGNKKTVVREGAPATSIDIAPPLAAPAPAATVIDASGVHALVPLLEARLQALQAKVASMEESREEIAASKAKSEEELREMRITVELVTAEKQKMAGQLEEQKKKSAAAEKLAKEKDAALKAQKAHVVELTEKVVESKAVRSREQEDEATTWQAKISTLTSEMEKLKTELENAIETATEAKKAQNLAEIARFEAEQKESAAEQRAIVAMNEATQLRAASTHAQDQSVQLQRDNDRRSKTFNAAVEAQVQKFRAGLEEERDKALIKVEESQKENLNLQQRLSETTAALQEARESAEEHAAAVVVEKNRVEEYEQVVKTMQGQVAAAVKAMEDAEEETKDCRLKWQGETSLLKNKLVTLENELKDAVEKAQISEKDMQTVQAEAEQWRAAAQRVEELQAAEAAGRKDVDAATAEATALKIQIAQLQSEMNENSIENTGTLPRVASSSGGGGEGGLGDFTNAASAAAASLPGTASKNKNESTSSLPGSRSFRRDSSSNGLSGFDLESLRRTPLLSGHRSAAETQQRRLSSPFAGSSKQLMWMYITLVHVLLLIAMGRASHAHLACEVHLGAGGGGLP